MTAAGATAERVESVRGPLEPAALGRTSMHEHIFILSADLHRDRPELSWNGDRESRIAQAAAELDELKRRGIDTVVDLTVPGLGRSIDDVREVARRTELNIIAATGYYTLDRLPLALRSRPCLADLFVQEIEQGIGRSGVRAAVLKCCTDEPGLTPDVELVLRAVARAHRRTGVPIMTHTNAAERTGRDQQHVFEAEGVDLSRVVIGHCGDTTDLAYLRRLMDRGSVIGSDRFGFYVEGSASFEERLEALARLCELGYADRMVLGHDAHCHADWNHEGDPFAQLSDWHFQHLPRDVLPGLLRAGVTEDQLHQMLVENPRRILSARRPY